MPAPEIQIQNTNSNYTCSQQRHTVNLKVSTLKPLVSKPLRPNPNKGPRGLGMTLKPSLSSLFSITLFWNLCSGKVPTLNISSIPSAHLRHVADSGPGHTTLPGAGHAPEHQDGACIYEPLAHDTLQKCGLPTSTRTWHRNFGSDRRLGRQKVGSALLELYRRALGKEKKLQIS